MKDYITHWIPRLKAYSQKLDRLAKLYNQPWVIVNDNDDFVKIIFQDRGNLIVSNNGVVTDGSWELLSIEQSIVLEINGQKKLYNHQFFDKGLMILALDGHKSGYFILANQNIIPTLDIESYLLAEYKKVLRTAEGEPMLLPNEFWEDRELDDGRILQIVSGGLNSDVYIDSKVPKDGLYRTKDISYAFELKTGMLTTKYLIQTYVLKNGDIAEIGESSINGSTPGSPVWINGKIAPDGKYRVSWVFKFYVRNGRIV
jgi:hypothetical protein